MFLNIFIVILCMILAVQAKFPDDPKPCNYGDGDCIVKFINTLLTEKATTGDRDMNFVQVDPLTVAKLNLKQGAESPVNIDLTFNDNILSGVSSVRFTKVKGFGKNMAQTHEMRLSAQKMSLVGPYTIKGKVLILPISGTGQSNMTIVNGNMILTFTGRPVEKNGETYMGISNFKIRAKPERLYYHFSNLFNGDKALGDNMNAFLNDNWDAIFGELKLSIETAFAQIFESIIANVFKQFPYEKLFAE